MKRRYDVKVKPIHFEIGQLALYYCPRKRIGKNQKWRRLQQLCIIVKKLNDVLYCVKLRPRGESTVVHVDRLIKFCGDPPPKWKQYVNKQSTIGLSRCSGENNSGATNMSYEARDDNGLPADFTGHTVTTSPPTGDASSAVVESEDVTFRSPVGCRPQRTKYKPHRYRDINSRQIQTEPSIHVETNDERSSRDCSTFNKINMDLIAGSNTLRRVRKTRGRSEKQKEKRRNREKGPHPCPLCDHPPFSSISGLRVHVSGVHRKHCSWTKQISDSKPTDVTEAPQPNNSTDRTDVRALHLAGSSSSAINDGHYIVNDEQSAVFNPSIVESLEALFDELPLFEYPDDKMEPVAAGHSTLLWPAVASIISTETLTDVHGLPRVHCRAVQTPRSRELYLPVSFNRLVQLVRDSNGSSVADMLRQLGLDHGGFRTDEMQIVTLVLNAMVEARRDLIRLVIKEQEEAREAEKAAPQVGGLQKMADLTSKLFAEFHRPRPNPWPMTTAEFYEEPIHIMTPGIAAVFADENAVVNADEPEVTLIDSD